MVNYFLWNTDDANLPILKISDTINPISLKYVQGKQNTESSITGYIFNYFCGTFSYGENYITDLHAI